jgi:DNA-binding transcriptional ArsR family regulator
VVSAFLSIVENELDGSGERGRGNGHRVLHFIQENPGCYLRLINRELEVSIGTVQYHLAKLEKMGKITANRYGLYKYYFPIGIFQENQKNVLQVLSQETARGILMVIIEQKNPTQKDIINSIGVSSAAINWHIRRLISLNIIYEIRDGKYKRYQLRIDHKYIVSLLRNYYPNIWDKWSNRLIELFLSLSTSSSSSNNSSDDDDDDEK